MTTPSQDDELLSILLVNLRNAAATFGEGTPPYESIRTTIEEHVQAMRAKGSATNLTNVRQRIKQPSRYGAETALSPSGEQGSVTFANLVFRPKPSNKSVDSVS